MKPDLNDLAAFVAVSRAGGFRDAARRADLSASGLSEAVRRLEARMGVRLLHRTTRSVAPTEAGARLLERLGPALSDIDSALEMVNDFRERPAGTLRLNVPESAARLVLPDILPAFLGRYPDIRLDVVVEEGFVDVLAAGCDAGIRYEERLEQDMIAVPIGPRVQRFAAAASPAYLDAHGRPEHPRDLLGHRCLLGRFASGYKPAWEFERDGEIVRLEPDGPLTVRLGGGADLLVSSAVSGLGVVMLFDHWLAPHFASGALEPVLEDWWEAFSGPFLYYPGRRHLPTPLRAFVDFVKEAGR
ncbi:LysR family transcriptional regulator [Stakelama saccharophila]|uniref:LysR family transcriptional regulator n=1 Tax=Stakelama saccharophila TaxID=3075605 RepID=A0ABZ0B6R3_9SPHN|nr:LysR family transcriptional regulator [Stakelama sp. W311]WNO53084.1 LysR family transcriptional regulator [Stakelama sp. W311]